jgi:RNA polymerase sigma-70 factor (ECF subfamily)
MMPSPRPPTTHSEPAITALLAQRAVFRRFLARRLGDSARAEDILHDSLLRALRRGHDLPRGDNSVAWFYRILRHAVADHFRGLAATRRRLSRVARDLSARGEDVVPPAHDVEEAVCRCFKGLLAALPKRHAEILRRVDLRGEPRPAVARALGLGTGAFDVAVHRARQSLRARLEVFCGACSREHCLACSCA